MSYNDTISFEEGLQRVQGELEDGTSCPHEEPRELPLDDIKMRHSVFQPREFDNPARSEDHVRALSEAIKAEPSNRLDAVTVWWSGKHWTVLNGHHRLLAYGRVRKTGFKQHQPDGSKTSQWMVPVRRFRGTLQDALIEATRTNSKDHLSMTKDEKMNRAWRLTVLYDELSKRAVAGACKIGSRTVARMRSQLREIQEDEPDGWKSLALGMSWREAQRYGKGEGMEYDDSWQERQAAEWSRRLGKAFGTKFAEQPEVAARALELYSERLAKELGPILHEPEEFEESEELEAVDF
ncbi:hypothetical protein [Halomonas salinarum]|uniref:hypothetical protein n=1 Tax=Halomonas salinarum TaxID=1158993 RepID=UPI001438BD0D|nr:hypothetical protein [Halomonas salinarum]